jgi:hypothetical protein
MHTLVGVYLKPVEHVETQYQVEFSPHVSCRIGHVETHILEELSAYCL